MSKLNIIPAGHNKAVYYMLPLIGLNKYSLGGGDNFVNAYITINGKIVVVILNKDLAEDYIKHQNYITDFDVDITEQIHGTAIVYTLPEQFIQDFGLFLAGKYSEFSEEAKNTIRSKSGLPYRVPIANSSQVNIHKLLMVLDKSPVLRQWMEKQIDAEIDPLTELLEKPDINEEVMDIDTIRV